MKLNIETISDTASVRIPAETVAYMMGLPKHMRSNAREIRMSVPDAFEVALQIVRAAIAAQGEPTADPDRSEALQEARKARNAGWFEELLVQIVSMADSWHREAIRRRDGKERGAYSAAYLDPEGAIRLAGECTVEHLKDWW